MHAELSLCDVDVQGPVKDKKDDRVVHAGDTWVIPHDLLGPAGRSLGKLLNPNVSHPARSWSSTGRFAASLVSNCIRLFTTTGCTGVRDPEGERSPRRVTSHASVQLRLMNLKTSHFALSRLLSRSSLRIRLLTLTFVLFFVISLTIYRRPLSRFVIWMSDGSTLIKVV